MLPTITQNGPPGFVWEQKAWQSKVQISSKRQAGGKKRDFKNLVNHEINHVYLTNITKTWSPVWFGEGLASVIGNNFPRSKKQLRTLVKKYSITQKILHFRYLRRNSKAGHTPRYPIWQAFVEFLIRTYSIQHIKRFIQKFSHSPYKTDYLKIFKYVFGKSDRALFNEFLRTLD
jgi:hypothetical protein